MVSGECVHPAYDTPDHVADDLNPDHDHVGSQSTGAAPYFGCQAACVGRNEDREAKLPSQEDGSDLDIGDGGDLSLVVFRNEGATNVEGVGGKWKAALYADG